MKKFLGIVVLSLFWISFALAETVEKKKSNYIYNNLSFEYIECHHSLVIDPDPKLIKNYIDNAKLVSEIAFMYEDDAGMGLEGMMARSKQISIKMLKSLDKNFLNIAVIEEYEAFCRSLIETPEIRNQFWINKANEKYK